jgi:predicted DNA-binding transcriptional regulator YafY
VGLDRVDRLVALLPWLAANPDSSVSEVATRFEVTEKQILSDIMLLTLTGPDQFGGGLVDIAYEDRFVTVRDSKGLAGPVRIKQMEAIPLLIGLRFLENQLPGDLATEVQTLIKKLEAGSEVPGDASDSLTLVSMSEDVAKTLALVNGAISSGNLLRFDYRSVDATDSIATRLVKPQGIRFDGGYQYLTAFDLDRQAQRVFRLDRVSNCQSTTTNSAAKPQGPTADQEPAMPDRAVSPGPSATLELRLKPEAAKALDDYPSAEVDLTDGRRLIVTFPMYSHSWATQLVLSMWPWVIEVSPDSVRSAAIAGLERSLADHQT